MSENGRDPLDGITRIGVIGAGQMGRGIAQLAAANGFMVTLADAQRDTAERGRTAIGQQLARLVDKQKLTSAERDRILASIAPTDLYGGDLETVDFVVEAATEDFVTKREIFETLDRACRGGVILASNTSSISITKIGGSVTRPETDWVTNAIRSRRRAGPRMSPIGGSSRLR